MIDLIIGVGTVLKLGGGGGGAKHFMIKQNTHQMYAACVCH